MGTFAHLHCHSDHSLMDSPLKVPDLVDAAARSGAEAVALTDHGTCTGWIAFMKECAKKGINGIPGVEAYIKTAYCERAHLILLAKNNEGYREISRFITGCNENLVRNFGGNYIPVGDAGKLGEYFGNGNVVATTACINGPLGDIYMESMKAVKQREMLEAEEIYDPAEEYSAGKEKLAALDEEIKGLVEKRAAVQKTADKKYKARMKGLAAYKGEEYQALKEALDKEIAETKEAKKELEALKKEIAQKRSARTKANHACAELEKAAAKAEKHKKKIRGLSGKALDGETAYARAKETLIFLKGVFGADLYVEIQYHGMEEEKVIYPACIRAARECSVQLIAANDIHIATPGDAEARAFMHALRFKRWEAPSAPDRELCVKTQEELEETLLQVFGRADVEEALSNTAAVAAQCHVELPGGEHYPKYRENGVPVKDSAALLKERVGEGIKKLFPDGFDEAHRERLNQELPVIQDLGYSDYTLIVADCLNYAMEKSRTNNPEGIGYGTGPGRGSGAGCLVNYLMGITKLDPLEYGLLFERYLNVDRVSNPDIDSDYSNEVRDDAIRYTEQKYGTENVAGIRTVITQSAKAAVHNSASIRGYELYPPAPKGESKTGRWAREEGRRGIARIGDEICKAIPSKPGTKLSDHMEALKQLFPDEDSQVILRRALEVEGTITSTGMHAAGIIVGDGTPLQEYIPLSYNRDNGKWVTQCDMVEAEEIGLLKIDFLGLKNLDIISECIRRVKKSHDITIDPDRLPFEKQIFKEVFSKGETSCVFQFESDGMKRMLRDFKPEDFEDIILLVAAYRPGPMDFIPEIIDVKKKKKKASYILKKLEDILSPTYGKPIYQEQLMNIFHACAGFSLGEADIIRRYMSKKKVDAFLSYKPQFTGGITQAGADEKDAEELWDSLEGFAKYAFNKSHAAAYAKVSYQTAYLKYHYPLQYMCSMLNHPVNANLPALLCTCREMGIRILPPDINRSYVNFEEENGALRFGLSAVRNVASYAGSIIAEREAGGAFRSFTDFMLRWQEKSDITESLVKAGAFDAYYREPGAVSAPSSGTLRDEMLDYFRECTKYAEKIKRAKTDIRKCNEQVPSVKAAEKKKLEARILRKQEIISSSIAEIRSVPVRCVNEDAPDTAARYEKEMLGCFLTSNPLDAYAWVFEKKNLTAIDSLGTKLGRFVKCAGMVDHVRKAKRKSDGMPMCFFTLEDPTGTVNVSCFTKEYADYGKLAVEGTVIYVYGKAVQDTYQGEEKDSLVLKEAHPCGGGGKYVLVVADDRQMFEDALPEIRKAESSGGYNILLFDRSREDGHLESTGIRVSFGETLDLTREKKYQPPQIGGETE